MEELRFRYYIKDCKDFVYFINGLYYFRGKVGSYIFDWGKTEQYIGMLDKNGKEVYEGDYDKKYGVVKYINCEFVFENKDGWTSPCGIDDIEITDNIYENSELSVLKT